MVLEERNESPDAAWLSEMTPSATDFSAKERMTTSASSGDWEGTRKVPVGAGVDSKGAFERFCRFTRNSPVLSNA